MLSSAWKRFGGAIVAIALLSVIVLGKRLQTTPDRVYEPRPPAEVLRSAPIRFREEAASLGLDYRHQLYYPDPEAGSYLPLMAFPPAIAVADVDGDGWMDIYVVQPKPGLPSRLFHNEGGTHFVDIAEQVGLADAARTFAGSMAVWADFNRDGRLDLLQSRFGCHTLFLQDAGSPLHFTARQDLMHLYCSNPKAVNVADMNHDGWLDLVFGNYYPARDLASYLPLNHVFGTAGANVQGGGTDVILGSAGGFGRVFFRGPHAHTTAIGISDIDDDGWPDVFAANDYTYDQMLRNASGRGLVDVTDDAIPRVEHGLSGMDAEFADFDDSGAMSLFVSNMYFPPFATTHNLLWRKTGPGRFANVADEQGVARCGWAWTGKFADFDDDGRLDLFVVNGKARGGRVRTKDEATRSFAFVRNSIVATPPALREQMSLVPDFAGYTLSAFERSCVFWHQGDRFYDVAVEAGVTDLEEGQAAALVDFDNDGRLDVVVASMDAPLLAYHDVTSDAGHWVGLDVVGPPVMRTPYGTKVFLHRDDGKTPMRELYPANGFRGQNDPRVHFGLGKATRVPDVEVRWPDGRVELFRDLPLDAYAVVRYGAGVPR
jgi:enediyne biosynthesis protein E4